MAPVPAGYSSASQAKKLGIKPGCRLSLDHAPDRWALQSPPTDVTLVAPGDPADVIISFFDQSNAIPGRLPELARRIYPTGALWIAWPRRAAGHVSDITDNVVRDGALPLGLVDIKVAAIDEDWSGLRFVWRVEARTPKGSKTGGQ
jgi:hypothetical protein